MTPKALAAAVKKRLDDEHIKIIVAASEMDIHHNTLRTFLIAPAQVGEETVKKIEAWVEGKNKATKA